MTKSTFEWPATPSHKLHEKGTFIVTGETLRKDYLFNTPEKLDGVQKILLKLAVQYNWQLEAWALFSNHYHFMVSSKQPENLDVFVQAFHAETAEMLSSFESKERKKVWSQYFVNKVVMQASHYAFLNFIHHNAVKHNLVKEAKDYCWCSALWFESAHDEEYVKKIKSFGSKSFGINNLTIMDDYT